MKSEWRGLPQFCAVPRLVLGILGCRSAGGVLRSRWRSSPSAIRNARQLSRFCLWRFCCELVSAGQGALIQGMRRIADLAKMNVLSALFGTCISIPLVYVLREKGVVPSLIVVAGMTIATSWWYSRKIQIQVPKVSLSEVRHEVGALLKLGSAFMASGLMTMGVAYLVRIIIARKIGFDATGFTNPPGHWAAFMWDLSCRPWEQTFTRV